MTDFTTPIPWPVGLDVTETILNQQIRDNFMSLDERAIVLETAYKSAIINIVPINVDVDTSSGIQYLPIPSSLDTMLLKAVKAFVVTAGITNPTTIQVRNTTKYAANDSLSAAMSIASGATSSTGGTIDVTYDDVSTDDILKIYVTAQSTTKPKGLYVYLEFVPA